VDRAYATATDTFDRTHNGGFEDAWVAKIGDASQTSTPTSKAASKTNTKAQGNPAQKAPSRG
jgi:hypothetical protein